MSGWEIAGLGLLVIGALFYGVVVPWLVPAGDELAAVAHDITPDLTDYQALFEADQRRVS